MRIYKVQATFLETFSLTAVVACDKAGDSFSIAEFDNDNYTEQEAKLIGDSIYIVPTLICREHL